MAEKKYTKGTPDEWELSIKENPCYSVRLLSKEGFLQVREGRNVIGSFYLSSFPKDMNLNDVDTLANIIKIVKESGPEGLKSRLSLKASKKR